MSHCFSNLTLQLITQAFSTIKSSIITSPITYSQPLSAIVGTDVYIKYESVQITGSFKVRGALFYLSTLSPAQKQQGVAACSAGNHGLGVAYAVSGTGIPCTIYVPKQADAVKVEKMRLLGAQVVHSPHTGYDDTLAWAEKQAASEGLHLISAFDDARIMAGNGGTLALEVLEQMSDVCNIIFPVGGGGLAAGLCYAIKEKAPHIRLIGCQHRDSPALWLSLQQGRAVTTLPAIDTLACGIEGGIGAHAFSVVQKRVDEVCLASEEQIRQACIWLLANEQYFIEPSAAVTAACCLGGQLSHLKGKTLLILTGRNVDLNTLQTLLRHASVNHENAPLATFPRSNA